MVGQEKQRWVAETKEQEIRTARDFSKGTLEARNKPFKNSGEKKKPKSKKRNPTSNLDFYYSIFMDGKSGGSMMGSSIYSI